MFSKSAALVVTGLAFLAPLAVPAAVQAQPVVVVTTPVARYHRYFVEYRPAPFAPWSVYGPYRSRSYAHDVARGLRAQGFMARVVRR
jgi:hypothetical protein